MDSIQQPEGRIPEWERQLRGLCAALDMSPERIDAEVTAAVQARAGGSHELAIAELQRRHDERAKS